MLGVLLLKLGNQESVCIILKVVRLQDKSRGFDVAPISQKSFTSRPRGRVLQVQTSSRFYLFHQNNP